MQATNNLAARKDGHFNRRPAVVSTWFTISPTVPLPGRPPDFFESEDAMALKMCCKCHGRPVAVTVPRADGRGDDGLCTVCAGKRKRKPLVWRDGGRKKS